MSSLYANVFSFIALLACIYLAFKVGTNSQENKELKKEIEHIAQEQEHAKNVKEAIAAKSDSDVVKRVRSIKRKKTSK